MNAVKDYFNKFYTEIGKYKQGIHVLNDGISEISYVFTIFL